MTKSLVSAGGEALMNADTSGIAKLIVARVRGDAVRMKAIPKTVKNAAGM